MRRSVLVMTLCLTLCLTACAVVPRWTDDLPGQPWFCGSQYEAVVRDWLEDLGLEDEQDFFLCVSTLGQAGTLVHTIAVQFDDAAIVWGGRRDLLSPALETGLLYRQRRIVTFLGLDTRILYVDMLAEALRDPDAAMSVWARQQQSVAPVDDSADIPGADAPR